MTKAELENRLREDLPREMAQILWPETEKKRLLAAVKGAKPMKKRISLGVLAAAVLVALLCAGALGASLQETEMPAIQPLAQVQQISFAIPQEGKHPAAVLTIDEMHYDGQNLLIGYHVEGDWAQYQEPFEDVNKQDREKSGQFLGYGGEYRLFKQYFPRNWNSRKPKHLSAFGWGLACELTWEGMDEGALPADKMWTAEDGKGITYLCFEGLHADLKNKDFLSLRIPLWMLEASGSYYDDDNMVFHGVLARIGPTKHIAVTVPASGDAFDLPASRERAQRTADVLELGDNTWRICARDGMPAYIFTLEEAVSQGTSLRIAYRLEGQQMVMTPDTEPIQWYPVTELEDLGALRYYEEQSALLEDMQAGDATVLAALYAEFSLYHVGGERLAEDLFYRRTTAADGLNIYQYRLRGTYHEDTDQMPFWYGQESFTVYMSIRRELTGARIWEDGTRFVSRTFDEQYPYVRIPIHVQHTDSENPLFDEVLFQGVLGFQDEGGSTFSIAARDGAPDTLLEIKEASFDGKRILLGFTLTERGEGDVHWQVSRELQTVQYDKTAPWYDFSAWEENGVTYYAYDLRETMNPDARRNARTADDLNWYDADQVVAALVMEKYAGDEIEDGYTPRLYISMVNHAK